MNYFEELQKDTEIIKALAGEIIKSSADDEAIMTTSDIVIDSVYRLKIAKENGISSRESYLEDCLKFAKEYIETLKKFYLTALFDEFEKSLKK